MTYVLEGLLSLPSEGWHAGALLSAVLAIVVVGVVSNGLALVTLIGRASRSRTAFADQPRRETS
jgi:hypothetical protein